MRAGWRSCASRGLRFRGQNSRTLHPCIVLVRSTVALLIIEHQARHLRITSRICPVSGNSHATYLRQLVFNLVRIWHTFDHSCSEYLVRADKRALACIAYADGVICFHRAARRSLLRTPSGDSRNSVTHSTLKGEKNRVELFPPLSERQDRCRGVATVHFSDSRSDDCPGVAGAFRASGRTADRHSRHHFPLEAPRRGGQGGNHHRRDRQMHGVGRQGPGTLRRPEKRRPAARAGIGEKWPARPNP